MLKPKLLSWLPLGLIITLYLGLSLSGIRYGLPSPERPLSYNCDELQWIEALLNVKAAERHHNPYPTLCHPTFYLEVYGLALAGAAVSGWIPLKANKEWYSAHRDSFARVYLVGRYLQVVFGCGVLLSFWYVGRTIFDYETAFIASLLLAVCPSFVAASHFSQNNLPVAAMTFFSLSCLLLDQHFGGERPGFLYTGALLAGLAMSTKYSAAPILIILAYRAWQQPHRSRAMGLIALVVGLGFIIGAPYALLSPRVFYESFLFMRDNIMYGSDTWWHKTIFPLTVTLPNSMGIGLAIAVVLAIISNLFHWKQNPVLWLWSITFWLGFLVVGRHAIPGRSLVLLVPLVLLAAHRWVVMKNQFRVPTSVFYAGVLALVLSTVLPSLAIVESRRMKPIQDQSSEWIITNIPTNKVIGIPRPIYWWSPTVIYQSAHHPERMTTPYSILDLDYSVETTRQRKPDYVVVAGTERQIASSAHAAFFTWLDTTPEYQLIKQFPRRLQWRSWRWDRPERRFNFDDDLWQSSISIYQRANLPSTDKPKS